MIGKYAAIDDPAAAAKKFRSKSWPIDESIIRGFRAMYKAELEKARKEKHLIMPDLNILLRRRPLSLGSLDQMVQKFLLALQSRGGLITWVIAASIAKALVATNTRLMLDHNHIDLNSSPWAKSLFDQIGFKKRI